MSRNYTRPLTVLVVILIIVAAIVAYGWVTSSGGTTTIKSTTAVTTPLVGTFLYLWYGYNFTSHRWTGGLNTSHWNDSPSGVVKDMPAIGYYASLNNNTLATQLSEIKEAGISVIVVSWWGTGNTTQSVGGAATLDAAIDNATLNLFRYLEETRNQWQFKVAIMVEPFYQEYSMTPHDYAKLYGYLGAHYYGPYSDLILNWQGKPLVTFFNTGTMNRLSEVPVNSTYTVRLVGGYPNQVNWYFWEGMNFLDSSGGTNVTPSDYERSLNISSDGEVGIAPRYDDYYLWQAGGRQGYMRFDHNMSEGMYSSEWNNVLEEGRNVSLILIYSWNEYHERTAIEPHHDFSANVSSTYLLDLTPRYAALTKATIFLVSKYSLHVGLISETGSSQTYWLYSDNFLATLALRQVGSFDPYLIAIADNISATNLFYVPKLGIATNQYMVLSSSWTGPCGFDSARSYIVAQSSNVQINVTLNNSTGILLDSDYADIAFLTAICLQHQGNHGEALTAFNLGVGFFDGIGFADQPFTNPGPSHDQYQTYKLALYVYAGKLLSQPVNQAALATLLKMQAPDGGFYTGYYANLTHDNSSNTETTSLVILALSG